jgi:O-acetyl-ADP-ribose deacetylase (regulator of RNase III)
MTVTTQEGDIFQSNAQTLVNTVNCEGYMGKGLALQFKRAFPEVNRAYREACRLGLLRPGRPQLVKTNRRWVLNFPTKDRWRQRSRIEYIEEGLEAVVANYKSWGVESMAFPQLGSGLGGLDWQEVKLLMLERLEEMDIPIEIWEHPGFEREGQIRVPRTRGSRRKPRGEVMRQQQAPLL